MTSICTPVARCDMHRDEPATTVSVKCPGLCDAEGCTTEATIDVGDECFCRADAARILAAS